MSKGKGQYLLERVMAGPNPAHERSIRQSEAVAFRARLALMMRQMSEDPKAPMEIVMAMPFLVSQMDGMSDEKLLGLKEFLVALVGEDEDK